MPEERTRRGFGTARYAGWLLLGLLLVLAAPGPDARAESCAETSAKLIAVPEPERSLICRAAVLTEQFLAGCGLRVRDSYAIGIEHEIRNEGGARIFGRFTPWVHQVSLLSLDESRELVDTITETERAHPYKAIPAAEFYYSIAAHEIAHAVSHQHLTVKPTRAVYEYVSGVLQYHALEDGLRARVIAFLTEEPGFSRELFNDIVQAMDPIRYGAEAYRHFMRPGNGCAFLRDLLTNEDAIPRVWP